MTTTALIVAAGKGERAGGGVPKQFRLLGGKPVLRWAVESLIRHPAVQSTRVVIADGQQASAAEALDGLDVGELITGGAERAGFGPRGTCRDRAATRCWSTTPHGPSARRRWSTDCSPRSNSSKALRRCFPSAIRLAQVDETLGEPVDRTGLARVQTPQAFRLGALRSAYERWTGPSPTDETTVVRAAGMKVAAVEGDPALEKLTLPSDFDRAEQWLAGRLVSAHRHGLRRSRLRRRRPDHARRHRGAAFPRPRRATAMPTSCSMLSPTPCLAPRGLATSASISRRPTRAGRARTSSLFLEHAVALLRDKGAMIDHLDCTIIAEAPKVGPHRQPCGSGSPKSPA